MSDEKKGPRFRIRRVDETDPKIWAQIVTMDARCFHKIEAPALSNNDGAWWIAYAGGKLAGYCGIKTAGKELPGAGYLVRAGVLPEFRGCGLQKKMIERRLAYAKGEGWKFCVSDTCNNAPSANSLISSGFKVFDPAQPWSFEHSTYWKKFLLPK